MKFVLSKEEKKGFHYIDEDGNLYKPKKHATANKKLSLLDLEKDADETIKYEIKLSDKLIEEGWLFDTEQRGNSNHKFPGRKSTCSFQFPEGINLLPVNDPKTEIQFECSETKLDRTAYDLHLVHSFTENGTKFQTSIIIDPIIRNGT